MEQNKTYAIHVSWFKQICMIYFHFCESTATCRQTNLKQSKENPKFLNFLARTGKIKVITFAAIRGLHFASFQISYANIQSLW